MKQRNYQKIGISKTTTTQERLHFNHLVGQMKVSNMGGAYVLPIPCGGGKTTMIVSLCVNEATSSFVIFVKTRQECRDLYDKLISMGVLPSDILMIYSPSPEEEKMTEDYNNNPITFQGNRKIAKHTKHAKDAYGKMTKTPKELSKVRILILTSIHLSTNFLPELFTYNITSDLERYVGKTKELLCSNDARKYIVIDELPEHIKSYITVNGPEIVSHFGVVTKTGDEKTDIKIGNDFLKPESFEKMKSRYSNILSNSKNCYFFGRRSELNTLKSYEYLSHLKANFRMIGRSKTYQYHQNLNDIVSEPRSMKSNIYLFDATSDVISKDWNGSKFKLVQDKKYKKYCSPIEFKSFYMDFRRWNNTTAGIERKVPEIANILEGQIKTLGGGKLLIVTWKDMKLYGKGEDYSDKDVVNISERLEKELSGRGLFDANGEPLYSIIYRGSGQDKATNRYKDFAAITFLGEWKCKSPQKLLKQTFGLDIKEKDLRLAWMIQTICRIRIRNHDHDPITVFYSEDIDQKLMTELQKHFIDNTDLGITVHGVPQYVASKRDSVFIGRVRKLIRHDSNILSHLQSGSATYVCSIPLNTINALVKIGSGKPDSYRNFKNQLLTEYNVRLIIT